MCKTSTVQMVVRNSKIVGFQHCTKNLSGKIMNCKIRGDFSIFRVSIPLDNKKTLLRAQKSFL